MIKRDAGGSLRRLLRAFPAVLVAGPRQCGKTTLVHDALKNWRALDLENPTDFDALSSDPEGFFLRHSNRVLIDEAQRWPGLFPILRGVIDARRRPGMFVLTGSAHPALIRQAGESLAGRLGLMELTPFGASELISRTQWLRHRWFFGGLPPVLALRSNTERALWLRDYVAWFLERDIPALGLRVAPTRLRKLWEMLCHVHGEILNMSDLARGLDLDQKSVSHHLDILEGAFMIRRLQPYFANIGKRLVKSPKLYIRDTGLLHFLAGLRSPDELETWPRRGQSWEGYVIEELTRRARLSLPAPEFYYWRTQAGAEADLLIFHGSRRAAFEIKSGATLTHASLAGLRQCMQDLNLRRGFVVYQGEKRLDWPGGISVLPWSVVEKGGLPGFDRF